MDYFGSSGIRGIINKKITPELCLKVGRAVGNQYDDIIIGTDPRTTADMVKSAVISGLTASGADVKDAGMVPTPTLAQAADEFDCGVMITASHNTAEYNGIKLWNPDGSSFDTEQAKQIEEDIDSEIERKGTDLSIKQEKVETLEDEIEEIRSKIESRQERVSEWADVFAQDVDPGEFVSLDEINTKEKTETRFFLYNFHHNK